MANNSPLKLKFVAQGDKILCLREDRATGESRQSITYTKDWILPEESALPDDALESWREAKKDAGWE